eukprot:jgi/Ulvmu1/3331/UM155_0014.1
MADETEGDPVDSSGGALTSKRNFRLDGLQLSAAGTLVAPDTSRVIIHFDIDCFYAQVEEVRNPALKGQPVGVTQKYLIVTSNYEARARGVTKLSGIKEALAACPELQLVPGEDLTPYRSASKQIWALLDKFGRFQGGGLDEAFLDATDEVLRRIEALEGRGQGLPDWHGHVWHGTERIVPDSRHRLQDLRIAKPSEAAPGEAECGPPHGDNSDAQPVEDSEWVELAGHAVPWEKLLRVGSVVAAEARRDIASVAGFRTSAGIACNKLMAKLVSGLHKPDDQTVMPPPAAAAFVAPLPVRSLPGVGHKTNQTLAGMAVYTVADMRARPKAELERVFGATLGQILHLLSTGNDNSVVTPSGPPKAITCEDSFKSCTSLDSAATVIRVIAPDLAERVVEEFAERQRWPKTFTIKWRFRKAGFHRAGTSHALPAVARPGCTVKALESVFEDLSRKLLKKHLPDTFDLTLLNVGVTTFADLSAPAGVSKISALFQGKPARAAAEPGALDGTKPDPQPSISLADDGMCETKDHTTRTPVAAQPDGLRLVAARRDYKRADGRAVVSKRRERALLDAMLPVAPDRPPLVAAPTDPTGSPVSASATVFAPILNMHLDHAGCKHMSNMFCCTRIPIASAPMRCRGSRIRTHAMLGCCSLLHLRWGAGAALGGTTAVGGRRVWRLFLCTLMQHRATGRSLWITDCNSVAARCGGRVRLATPLHVSVQVLQREACALPVPHAAVSRAGPAPAEPLPAATAAALRQAGLIDTGSDDGEEDGTADPLHTPPPAAAAHAVAPLLASCGHPHAQAQDVGTPPDLPGAEQLHRSVQHTPDEAEVIEDTDNEALMLAVETVERELAARSTHASSSAPPAMPNTSSGTPVPPAAAARGAQAAAVTPASVGFMTARQMAARAVFEGASAGAGASVADTVSPAAGTRPTPQSAAARVFLPQLPQQAAPAAPAYTPSSWSPSPWAAPESVGIPGVMRYEAVDDYDTDRTGSTLNPLDPDVSPAFSTPHGPSPLLSIHPALGGPGPAADCSAGRPASIPAPAAADLGEISPTEDGLVGGKAAAGSGCRAAGTPVVKLPSLKGTLKRHTPRVGDPFGACSPAASAGTPAAAAGSTRPQQPAVQNVALAACRPDSLSLDAPVVSPPELQSTDAACGDAAAPSGRAPHAVDAPAAQLERPQQMRVPAGVGGPPEKEAGAADAPGELPSQPGSMPGSGGARAEASGLANAAAAADVHKGSVGSEPEAAGDEFLEGGFPEEHAGSGGALSDTGRVILHVDVDSFYCQVEILDRPDLEGKPIAVQQFNAGGFVAVSYEAKAAGVKKGDGVGAGGLASIPHLQKIGAVSMEEARRKCPGLQVLPMRTDRYRDASEAVLAALREFAADRVVQRQGYDDFYLDVTPSCSPPAAAADGASEADPPVCPPRCQVVLAGDLAPPQADRPPADGSSSGWPLIPRDLAAGCAVAHTVQRHIKATLNINVSVGVSRTRLLARLLSPLNKPRGISVLPPSHIPPFMAATPLSAIPSLGGKAGARLKDLGASTVGDLCGLSHEDMAAAADSALLATLWKGGLEEELKDAGPRQSIAVERSFQATELPSRLRTATAPLVDTLCRRVAADVTAHRRLPQKLVASWRHGYGAVRSKTFPVPHKLIALLRPCLLGTPLALGSLPSPVPDTSSGGASGHPFLAGGDETGSVTPGALTAVDFFPGQDADGSAMGSEAAATAEGGSQGRAGAAANASALAEVVEGVTAAVISQIEDHAEHPLRITRISVAATFAAAVATHAGQQCMHAFLSGSAGGAAAGASPAASPAASQSPAAKLQKFFQAGVSPPSRRALPFSSGSPGNTPRSAPSAPALPAARSASAPEPRPQRTTAPPQPPPVLTAGLASGGRASTGSPPHPDAGHDASVSAPAGAVHVAAGDARAAAVVRRRTPQLASPLATSAPPLELGSPGPGLPVPAGACTSAQHACSPTAAVAAAHTGPCDGGASMEAAAGALHPRAEAGGPSARSGADEREDAAGVCTENVHGLSSDAGMAVVPTSAVHAGVGGSEEFAGGGQREGAATAADRGDGANGSAAAPQLARDVGSKACGSATPSLPAAVSEPFLLPQPIAGGSQGMPGATAAGVIDGTTQSSADHACDLVHVDEAHGHPAGGAGGPAALAGGQEAVLEDAVRRTHMQSLCGDRLDLDSRLALRLQQEELHASKRARPAAGAGSQRAASSAKGTLSAARPGKRGRSPPSRRGNVRGRVGSSAGTMRSLDTFFKGRRNS